MKQHSLFVLRVIPFLFILLSIACNKEPFKPDYTNAGGYVIGKESCKGIDTDEYWLVDLTVYPNTPQYGDALTLNGTAYTNVVKLKGLDQRLQQVGMRVSIDFKTVTANKIVSNGCTVATPSIYALKELFIINQGEIR